MESLVGFHMEINSESIYHMILYEKNIFLTRKFASSQRYIYKRIKTAAATATEEKKTCEMVSLHFTNEIHSVPFSMTIWM